VAARVGRVGVCAVSMQPVAWPEVPADTVRVARAAFPKGSLASNWIGRLC
jgi:hypothetical protein